MESFLNALKVQRWDDHRYYHHSRVNQTLHLVSAISFLYCYAVLFEDPALAALIAWLVSMTTRQTGHFFFEPRGYDKANRATHEYKEEIKVGYNLQRKRVLMAIWALSPLLLFVDPAMLGLFESPKSVSELLRHVGYIWFIVGVGGFLFRIVQLCVLQERHDRACVGDEDSDGPVSRHRTLSQIAALFALQTSERSSRSGRRRVGDRRRAGARSVKPSALNLSRTGGA